MQQRLRNPGFRCARCDFSLLCAVLQVTELGVRMQRTEGAINGMQAMKEAWETQRAAEEFARQIRKLEEVRVS